MLKYVEVCVRERRVVMCVMGHEMCVQFLLALEHPLADVTLEREGSRVHLQVFSVVRYFTEFHPAFSALKLHIVFVVATVFGLFIIQDNHIAVSFPGSLIIV